MKTIEAGRAATGNLLPVGELAIDGDRYALSLAGTVLTFSHASDHEDVGWRLVEIDGASAAPWILWCHSGLLAGALSTPDGRRAVTFDWWRRGEAHPLFLRRLFSEAAAVILAQMRMPPEIRCLVDWSGFGGSLEGRGTMSGTDFQVMFGRFKPDDMHDRWIARVDGRFRVGSAACERADVSRAVEVLRAVHGDEALEIVAGWSRCRARCWRRPATRPSCARR